MLRPSSPRPLATGLLILAGALLSAAGCGGRTPPPASPGGATPAPAPAPQRSSMNNLSFDATPLYRQMGMIARGTPFPLLGRTGFLGSGDPDTTHLVVALTFANSSLFFAREADDRFRANYDVSIVIARGSEIVTRSDAEEEVLVGSYRESTREDHSIVFQELFDVAPGKYTLGITLRDRGSRRTVEERMEIEVPRVDAAGLSTPLPVLEVVSRTTRATLPNFVLAPSGTAIVGKDSIVPLYVESYGGGGAPIRLLARNENGRLLYTDTVTLASRQGIDAGVVAVPVARLGIGVSRLTFVRDGSTDSATTSVFTGFGGDLPVATFEDLLSFLRYFATPARLDKLRSASDVDRPAAWVEFTRATDSHPQTAEHEDLRAYFAKLVRANGRFREEATPGWLSDRGRVFITLGEPDQLIEPVAGNFDRNRQQVWEYRNMNLQLVFYDQTGTGRWRLTQSSVIRFEAEFRRRLR